MKKNKLIIVGIVFIAIAIGLYFLITKSSGKSDNGTKNGGNVNGNGNNDNGNGSNDNGNGNGHVSPHITPGKKVISNDSLCNSNNCQEWLNKHNKYRGNKGYPPLIWSNTLADQSARYVKQMNNGAPYQHGDYNNPLCPHNQNCGQNLEKAIGTNSSPNAVDRWYDECKNYTLVPNNPEDVHAMPGEALHYTQVMWKDAKKVGCASQGAFSGCLYDRGNLLGDFSNNVPPPGDC